MLTKVYMQAYNLRHVRHSRNLNEIGFTWDGTKAQALRHGARQIKERGQQQSGQGISKEPEKKSGWLQHLKKISRDT